MKGESKMETLTRETNGQATRQTERFISPSASVTENADGYILELEMPGVNKDGLDISIENNELSITGRRSNPGIEGALIHRESRPHNYRRSFEIDPSIDTGKISARITQGVVTLTLPKAEEVKPRKIKVS
jgi:HSP20 family protein